MPNYIKLFDSILTSGIWGADDKTRIVWITMLVMADKNGEVHASIPGLARIAGVDVEAARSAIQLLSSPDPDSREKAHEGRRIEEIEGGWEILNHSKYRAMASKEESKNSNAERQRRHRQRNATVTHSNATVTHSNATVTHSNATVTHSNATVTHNRDIADTDTDTDNVQTKSKEEGASITKSDAQAPPLPLFDSEAPSEPESVDQIIKRINAIRPVWQKAPHLTSQEQHDIFAALEGFRAISGQQWANLAKWATSADGSDDWTIKTRSRFIANFSEAIMKAEDWIKAETETPAHLHLGGRRASARITFEH
jgi:hypothetical protein